MIHMKLLALDSDIQNAFGKINPPAPASNYTSGNGAQGLSAFVTNLINLIFIVGALVFVFMLVWGAFQWMTSGGEKEKVAEARKRITYAIIGMVLMAVTFLLLSILGKLLHFSFFHS
jgi:hypothetical protein